MSPIVRSADESTEEESNQEEVRGDWKKRERPEG